MKRRPTTIMMLIGIGVYSWTAMGSDQGIRSALRNPGTPEFLCDCQNQASTYCQLQGDSIPDGHNALVVSIVVPYEYIVMDVDVCLDINHPHLSDLSIELRRPGQGDVPSTVLVSHTAAGADFSCTRFDNEAERSIEEGTAPYAGSFRPTGSFAAFTGDNGYGEWLLVIRDTVAGNRGEFNGACLSIWGPSCLPLDDVVISAAEGMVALHWTAPERSPYQVWSTTVSENDGDPRGDDPEWVLETELFCDPGVASWLDPGTQNGYKNYVVTRTCEFSSNDITLPGERQPRPTGNPTTHLRR